MKYTLYTLLLLVASLISKAQTTAVSIKWKIAPNDTVIYSMAMNSIEIAKSDSSSIATSPAGAGDDSVFFSKMLSKLAKSLTTDYNYTSRMYLNTKGSINVELVTKSKTGDAEAATTKDTIMDRIMKDFKNITKNRRVVLRGCIGTNGNIESFYTKNEQKNLVALLFELPETPKKVGDTWPLDLHLISMDENFVCDTSFRKNEVMLK